MAVIADHHIFRFQIPVYVACPMQDFQGGDNLVTHQCNCLNVELLVGLLEYVINTSLKLLHDEKRVGGQGLQRVNKRKPLGLHEFSQYFELLLH